MERYFLVHPISDDWQQLAWCLVESDVSLHVERGDIDTFSQAAQNTPIVVLFPGKWLNLLTVELPKARSGMLKKALPFLLEEQLAQDVENVHITLPVHFKGGEATPVAVTDKSRMQTFFTTFQTKQLNLQQACPDWLALPLFPDTWTIQLGKEYAFVRQNETIGFCVQKDLLLSMLHLALSQATVKPQAFHVYHLALEAADMEEQLNAFGLPLAYEAMSDEPLLLWAQHMSLPPAINLLHDAFFIKPKVSEAMRLWRMAGGLAVAIIGVQLLHSTIQYHALSKQDTILNEQILSLYQEVFPDATQTNNARSQLETVLASAGATTNNPLFAYLQDISEPLLTMPNVVLQEIALQNDTMRIRVTLQDFATLSQLESALAATGLKVTQDSASLEENRVIAQLHLSRGGQ